MGLPDDGRAHKGGTGLAALLGALCLLAPLTGCQDDREAVQELERLAAARRAESPSERAARTARLQEATGASPVPESAPVGCPPGFPLEPGYEVEGGSVDPGVIALCSLVYARAAEPLADAMAKSATEAGFTLERSEASSTGTLRLRFVGGEPPLHVSVAIRSDGQRSVVQLISRESTSETN